MKENDKIETCNNKNNDSSLLNKSYKEESFKSLKSVDIIKQHEKQVNSISFSDDGNYLISSGNDNLICLYNLQTNQLVKKLYNKVYGVENAVFTHSNQAILCSSSIDYRIMYWNLHSNEVMMSFKGHSENIIDIVVNPKNDAFISICQDKTSRYWDLANRKCLGIIQECNYSTFDNTGDVLASVSSFKNPQTNALCNYLNLYNTLDFIAGSFNIFKIEDNDATIKYFKFSNDGLTIINITDENVIIIIHSFEGNMIKKIESNMIDSNLIYKFDISPDSNFIITGSDNGSLYIWDIKESKLSETVVYHPKPTKCVKFNPIYNIITSACENIIIWQPKLY